MSSSVSSVPMLDVNRQNSPLALEIDAALASVTRTGTFINGPACRDFEAAFAEFVGVDHAIGCASGSDALLLPLMAREIGPGDEVLLPSFTFFATAGAVWRVGAKPVFVDILPDTFNIDPADLARKITPLTKAVMPVHLFGQAADMQAIEALALAHKLTVVEDAAQAIGATWGGRPVGSIGDFGGFSFYPTKNLGGFGDGGIITTNNDEHAEMLRRLRNHGQHPRYHHHVVGLNSRLDALQAAALGVKLPHVEAWSAARAERAARYLEAFADLEQAGSVGLPKVAADASSVWNQFTIRVKAGRRDELHQALGEQGVGSAIYYPVPLHLQACFAGLEHRPGDLPHTELAAEEVLSLPMFPEMTTAEQDRVIEVVGNFFAGTAKSQSTASAATIVAPTTGANVDMPSTTVN